MFKQTVRDVKCMYRDIEGYYMKYDEFKGMRLKTWSEKFGCLYADAARYKKEGINRNFTKTHKLKSFQKVKLFSFLNVVFT